MACAQRADACESLRFAEFDPDIVHYPLSSVTPRKIPQTVRVALKWTSRSRATSPAGFSSLGSPSGCASRDREQATLPPCCMLLTYSLVQAAGDLFGASLPYITVQAIPNKALAGKQWSRSPQHWPGSWLATDR